MIEEAFVTKDGSIAFCIHSVLCILLISSTCRATCLLCVLKMYRCHPLCGFFPRPGLLRTGSGNVWDRIEHSPIAYRMLYVFLESIPCAIPFSPLLFALPYN